MIDLHAHTTISDGTYSPRDLVREAKKRGLTAVAITDHDSIDGHAEAIEEAEKLGMTLVKGIEFSVSYGKGRLIHLLGLGIEPENEGFIARYTRYRQVRASKLTHVFRGLREMGVELTIEDVEPFVVGGLMDRQAIAKFLIDRGYTSIMKESWIQYIDHIPYIEGELIDPKTAIDAIHAAGGKAFMAHFHLPIGLKGYTEAEARERLQELKDMGLDGLEYYYPSFTKEDQLRCAQYIEDFNFLKSGGSDFHGANRANIQLGVGEGDFNVPDELLESILEPKKESASA